jgi:CheY-like chemotaxis protein
MVPGKILIADDSLKIQQQLTELLKSVDIEIVAVSNGEFAVRKLPEVKPDLVLADIFMPVRTGYEVCEFIKESEEFSQVPVLLLASTLEPYDEAEAERVKADGKIEKPFADPQATLATIKGHLDAVLSGKPPEPVVSADEFAAAVPAEESEPEAAAAPEPEAETMVMTPEAAPTLESSEEPMGFSEMLDHEAAAPAPAEPAAPPPAVDTPFAAALGEDEPAAPEPTPAAEAAPEKPREVEKPELAAAWEMTTAPEGAPEIPASPAWEGVDHEQPSEPILESADKVGDAPEDLIPVEEGATEAEAAPEPTPEEDMGPAEPFPPEEFAAAFGSEGAPAAAPAPDVAPPTPEPAPEPATAAQPATGSGSIDKIVEEVAKKVIEQLSPEVMEKLSKDLAKEIAKPLAEKLVKDKLTE